MFIHYLFFLSVIYPKSSVFQPIVYCISKDQIPALHYILVDYVQIVHELRQHTFEPLLKKLAHEILIAI